MANRVKKLSIPITVNRIMPHHYQKVQKSSDMSWTDTRHNINNNTADWEASSKTLFGTARWFWPDLASVWWRCSEAMCLRFFKNVSSNLLELENPPGKPQKRWCLISSKKISQCEFSIRIINLIICLHGHEHPDRHFPLRIFFFL